MLKRLDMEAALDEESSTLKYDEGAMTLREAYDELLEMGSGETNPSLAAPQDGGVVESLVAKRLLRI